VLLRDAVWKAPAEALSGGLKLAEPKELVFELPAALPAKTERNLDREAGISEESALVIYRKQHHTNSAQDKITLFGIDDAMRSLPLALEEEQQQRAKAQHTESNFHDGT
jgi:hypothetical protein